MSVSTSPCTGVAGVILAGGKSSRFGANKALHQLDGVPLVSRVAAALEPLFEERLLVTNSPDAYRFLGWPMTGDLYPGAGPLAGIHAALSSIRSEYCFVAACDMPNLDPRLIRLFCSLKDGYDAVVARLDSGREPLHAIYHRRCLTVFASQLASGRYRIGEALDRLKLREPTEKEILPVAGDLSAFVNINRPADLPLARCMA